MNTTNTTRRQCSKAKRIKQQQMPQASHSHTQHGKQTKNVQQTRITPKVLEHASSVS